MNLKAMNLFLSEANISKHLEFLRTKKLKMSILEKSIPQLKEKSPLEVYQMKLDKEVKNEALSLLSNIYSHDCYFSSFTEGEFTRSRDLKSGIYRDKLIYDIYTEAMKIECGFIYITMDNGKIRVTDSDKSNMPFVKFCPLLSIDLFEHAYFWDYGFNKDLYVRNALQHLDLSKLY